MAAGLGIKSDGKFAIVKFPCPTADDSGTPRDVPCGAIRVIDPAVESTDCCPIVFIQAASCNGVGGGTGGFIDAWFAYNPEDNTIGSGHWPLPFYFKLDPPPDGVDPAARFRVLPWFPKRCDPADEPEVIVPIANCPTCSDCPDGSPRSFEVVLDGISLNKWYFDGATAIPTVTDGVLFQLVGSLTISDLHVCVCYEGECRWKGRKEIFLDVQDINGDTFLQWPIGTTPDLTYEDVPYHVYVNVILTKQNSAGVTPSGKCLLWVYLTVEFDFSDPPEGFDAVEFPNFTEFGLSEIIIYADYPTMGDDCTAPGSSANVYPKFYNQGTLGTPSPITYIPYTPATIPSEPWKGYDGTIFVTPTMLLFGPRPNNAQPNFSGTFFGGGPGNGGKLGTAAISSNGDDRCPQTPRYRITGSGTTPNCATQWKGKTSVDTVLSGVAPDTATLGLSLIDPFYEFTGVACTGTSTLIDGTTYHTDIDFENIAVPAIDSAAPELFIYDSQTGGGRTLVAWHGFGRIIGQERCGYPKKIVFDYENPGGDGTLYTGGTFTAVLEE